VFSYGDAPFYGSTGAIHLSAPVVAMAPAPNDSGYWLAAMDGGVFSFGSAQFYGSMGATKLNQPVVGMAATPDGKGYWLVAADGGIFTFGDAQFYGSLGGVSLNAAVVGMAPTPDGKGYWLVAADGGVFTFGDAQFYGSLGSQDIPASIAGMAATPDGDGYWLVGTDGSVYSFGDATSYGSTASNKPLSPVAAIAATPDGKGYWLLEPDDFSYSFADPPPYDLGPSSSIVETASSQVQGDPDAGQGAFCNPYGPCEAWCALFATWVWRQVGISIPSYAFVGDIYDWAADNTVVLSPGQLPAPGDAILYGTGPQTVGTAVHTGIVVMVWPDGAVVTVEGDAGPAPTGQLAVVVNGPFLPVDSMPYNGFGVFGFDLFGFDLGTLDLGLVGADRGRACGGTTALIRTAIELCVRGAVRALLFGDQGLPVRDRDLIIVGVDFAKSQKPVAVAAVVDESGLQRGLYAGHFGEIDVAFQLPAAGRLEVEFLDAVAAHHHHPGLLRVGRVGEHFISHT